MTILEEIKQMQQQGYGEDDIVQKLKEAGYSPKDINYSLGQNKIKSAVEENVQNSVINQGISPGMEPSMLQQAPSPGQEPSQEAQQPATQEYYQPQQYQEYYQPQQTGISAETITEISEQIISEKLIEIKKVINAMVEFKSLMDAKVAGLDERLKRIESIISNLQTSIIGKIGSFGKGIEEVKEEMSMMQDSFTKMINPLARKKQQEEEAPEQIREQPRTDRTKKKKPGFEDFLRQ